MLAGLNNSVQAGTGTNNNTEVYQYSLSASYPRPLVHSSIYNTPMSSKPKEYKVPFWLRILIGGVLLHIVKNVVGRCIEYIKDRML